MNKVAVVTGSTSGIGRETAIHFAKLGFQVVVTGRRAELVNQVVEACESASNVGAKSIGVTGDVTIHEDAEQIINTAVKTFGRIDVLVNNAASAVRSPITDPNILEAYDRVMNLNLKAVVHLCHLTVPHLEKTKGCIVNVSSVAAFKPSPTTSVYCMSKVALNMFTKCLAVELGPKGIRVNCVNPAYIKTEFLSTFGFSAEAINAVDEEVRSSYPLRRVGEAVDVAKAIAFLSSEDASYITGDCMVIDGGGSYVNITRR